jgi:hypothetical protein
MSSPKGYDDYTGYSFRYRQYEGGVDNTNQPTFPINLLISRLNNLAKFYVFDSTNSNLIYEDSSYVTYTSIPQVANTLDSNTDFTFFYDFPITGFNIRVTAPTNSFDYFNSATVDIDYYIDPNTPPPPNPDDWNSSFSFNTSGVAPTLQTYTAPFINSPSYPKQTEGEIISVCNWISNNLSFFTEPIPQLVSTTLNG